MTILKLVPTPKPDKKSSDSTSRVIDFTVDVIERLEAPTSQPRVEYKDTKVQGLFLRVTKNGVKTFCYFGRPKGASGPERRTIGRFPQIKPAEARRMAMEFAGMQAVGNSVTAKSRERRQEMTVAELWELYCEHLDNKKSLVTAECVWRLYIEPKFGKRRLSEVQFIDVERWHRDLPTVIVDRRKAEVEAITKKRQQKEAEMEARRKIRQHGKLPAAKVSNSHSSFAKSMDGGTAANRCMETLRAMYNWASHQGRKLYTGPNPASGIVKHQENERSRFVQADELGNFFKALAQMTNETVRDAILTSLLAGARKSNILSMRWEDVSLTRKEWSLPGEFQKNGQPYVVPLVPELVELLTRRKAAHEQHLKANPPTTEREKLAAQYVFPTTKSSTGHIVHIAKQWASLIKSAGISDLRIHDLRRTMGSWQAKTGASLVVIGKSLNHRDHKATEIYARLDMDPVRDSMTTAVSAMFEAAGIKPMENNAGRKPKAE